MPEKLRQTVPEKDSSDDEEKKTVSNTSNMWTNDHVFELNLQKCKERVLITVSTVWTV